MLCIRSVGGDVSNQHRCKTEKMKSSETNVICELGINSMKITGLRDCLFWLTFILSVLNASGSVAACAVHRQLEVELVSGGVWVFKFYV